MFRRKSFASSLAIYVSYRCIFLKDKLRQTWRDSETDKIKSSLKLLHMHLLDQSKTNQVHNL